MIQLFINNIPVDMGDNITATIRKGAGILDFEAIEPTISLPMSLPYTPHNRKIFGHAERPASISNFGIYSAYLEYDGLAIEEGEFVLQKAKEASPYEGYFRADAGVLATNKNDLIGDILSARSVTFDRDSYTDSAFQDIESNVIFQPMVWYRKHHALPDYEEALFVNQSRAHVTPSFKIRHLLQAIFEDLGYAVSMQATSYLHSRLLILPKKIYATTLSGSFVLDTYTPSYSELLPEMKLSDFIRSCRSLGFAIGINSKLKEVSIKSLKEAFASGGDDWTGIAEPRPELDQAFPDGKSSLSFDYTPSEEATLPSVNFYFELSSADEGDVIEVVSEGQLYQAKIFGIEADVLADRPVSRAGRTAGQTDPADPSNINYLDFEKIGPASYEGILQGGGADSKSAFIPCPSSPQFRFKAKGLRIRDDGGNIKLGKVEGFLPSPATVRIIEPKELGQQWAVETTPRVSARYPDIKLPIAYTEDYDGVEVEFTIGNPKMMPEVREALQSKALITLYHGIHPDTQSNGYPFCSPGNLVLNNTTPVAPVTLKIDSIIEEELDSVQRIVSSGKLSTFKVRPTPRQLAGFAPIAPITINGVKYMPKNLEVVFGRGVSGEFEGWVI